MSSRDKRQEQVRADLLEIGDPAALIGLADQLASLEERVARLEGHVNEPAQRPEVEDPEGTARRDTISALLGDYRRGEATRTETIDEIEILFSG